MMVPTRLHAFLITVVGAVLMLAGCSHFSMDKYVSQDLETFKQEARFRTLAIMPLLVVGSTATSTNLFEIGRDVWLRRQTTGTVLTEGEVRPAEGKVLSGLQKVIGTVRLIPPDLVQRTIRNADARTEEEFFKTVAEGTGAEATLALVVRGFNSTQGGYGRESEGSARVTIICYNGKGQILWTLSTSYGYKISGFRAAPTLSDYMQEYMEQMEAPLRDMFGSMT